MNQNEIEKVLSNHKIWLESNNGERADLRNADLGGANLRHANLRHADLRDANLRDANLILANLSLANLRNADLSGANLGGADLCHANLRHANLRNTDLSGADLRHADLRHANFIVIGYDSRGYLFYGFHDERNVLCIRAACRYFVGLESARQHWQNRHEDNLILRDDILGMLDRAERMAKIRGWLTEVTS